MAFVLRFLNVLPNTTTLDHLNIDNFLLKASSELITPYLTHIFNLSIASGSVPISWKTARITPIFKGKGSQTELGNYRPISIIPTIAKIIEAFIKTKIISFLQVNSI